MLYPSEQSIVTAHGWALPDFGDSAKPERSAKSVPPEPRGLRGRGGERPFSNRESARERGLLAEMWFRDESPEIC